MSILEVRDVSIRYITGDFKDIGLKEYVLRKLRHDYHVTEFWADRDISFTLEQGDMLGIIGTNGAGKSTLLKVISGIMEPTQGSVHREGTIAALLELASGFDGDLTVRENTYLRGAMLGYTRKFMDEMYEQIMQFSELKEFEDRPFKQLSSGMKSRLAFSIASLVQPDILIWTRCCPWATARSGRRARRRCGRFWRPARPPSWSPTPSPRCGSCAIRSCGCTRAGRSSSGMTCSRSVTGMRPFWRGN